MSSMTSHASSPSQVPEGFMTGLDNTISTINLVKDVVPLEIAKGVLSTIAGVLSIVRVSSYQGIAHLHDRDI